MTSRKAKYALLLIGVSVLFLSLTAEAQPQPGVTATFYNNATWWNQYNNSPPLPPTTPVAGTTVVSQIDHSFDSEPMFGLYEDFVVRYESWLTTPCTCAVRFMAQADDGTILYLDNNVVTYDWWDKGGGGSISEPVQFQQGVPQRLLLWFYENGGGAWVTLYWMLDDQWEVIPASAYSTVESWTTTTTMNTLPPTTEPSSTSSPTSSSTTTTQPDPPTTTSTSPPVTTTQPSTTTTASPSPSTVSSSSTSPPVVTSTSKPSPTTTLLTTPTTTSTVASEASTSLPEPTETTTSTLTPQNPQTTNQNGKTFVRKVSFGPISFTLTATESQRRTVVAAAIVQITAVATISTTGVSTTSSSGTSTRRRR